MSCGLTSTHVKSFLKSLKKLLIYVYQSKHGITCICTLAFCHCAVVNCIYKWTRPHCLHFHYEQQKWLVLFYVWADYFWRLTSVLGDLMTIYKILRCTSAHKHCVLFRQELECELEKEQREQQTASRLIQERNRLLEDNSNLSSHCQLLKTKLSLIKSQNQQLS